MLFDHAFDQIDSVSVGIVVQLRQVQEHHSALFNLSVLTIFYIPTKPHLLHHMEKPQPCGNIIMYWFEGIRHLLLFSMQFGGLKLNATILVTSAVYVRFFLKYIIYTLEISIIYRIWHTVVFYTFFMSLNVYTIIISLCLIPIQFHFSIFAHQPLWLVVFQSY